MEFRVGLEPTLMFPQNIVLPLDYRSNRYRLHHNVIGDPEQIRTVVSAVKGRGLNHLTTGPHMVAYNGLEPLIFRV